MPRLTMASNNSLASLSAALGPASPRTSVTSREPSRGEFLQRSQDKAQDKTFKLSLKVLLQLQLRSSLLLQA